MSSADSSDLVQTELELGDDPEVPPAAAKAPEQVLVLPLVDLQRVAVCGDDLVRDNVVAGEAESPGEPAHASAEGQPADSGVGDVSRRCRQADLLSSPVQIAQQSAALHPRPAGIGIYPDGAQSGQVDQQAVVRHANTQDAVAAAADADLEAAPAGKLDGDRHIRAAGASNRHRWAAVDHRVPHGSSRVVAVVAGQHHRPSRRRRSWLTSTRPVLLLI